MEEEKKHPRTEAIKKALVQRKKAKDRGIKIFKKPKQKKHNKRSAKSRDLRSAKRGRLPIGTEISCNWDGIKWTGRMTVGAGKVATAVTKEFVHQTDGLFRLMEELDIKFWEWASRANAGQQSAASELAWEECPPKPEPWK